MRSVSLLTPDLRRPDGVDDTGPADAASVTDRAPSKEGNSPYPLWFHIPGGVLFIVLFAVPTFASFYFSLTRWTLFDTEFIGLDNFKRSSPSRRCHRLHATPSSTASLTSVAKVVLGLALGHLLTAQIIARGYLRSVVFFPVLVSTIGVGITFKILLDPVRRPGEQGARRGRDRRPGLAYRPDLALYSIILVDIWKGVGIATLIFIAGLVAIPQEYYEAAKVDGASRLAELPAHHAAAGAAGYGDGCPAVADRWPAVLRADLGDHQGRPRLRPATCSHR